MLVAPRVRQLLAAQFEALLESDEHKEERSVHEIGWLVGCRGLPASDDSALPFVVLNAIACTEFEKDNSSNDKAPKWEEEGRFLASCLPGGLNVVGLYFIQKDISSTPQDRVVHFFKKHQNQLRILFAGCPTEPVVAVAGRNSEGQFNLHYHRISMVSMVTFNHRPSSLSHLEEFLYHCCTTYSIRWKLQGLKWKSTANLS